MLPGHIMQKAVDVGLARHGGHRPVIDRRRHDGLKFLAQIELCRDELAQYQEQRIRFEFVVPHQRQHLGPRGGDRIDRRAKIPLDRVTQFLQPLADHERKGCDERRIDFLLPAFGRNQIEQFDNALRMSGQCMPHIAQVVIDRAILAKIPSQQLAELNQCSTR
jgi:hypothetical protein